MADDLTRVHYPGAHMVTQSVIFILLWLALNRYVKRYGPIHGSSTVIKLNSRIYSAASLVLFIVILFPNHDILARSLYHASKFYEYIDILNVTATGGSVDLHFGFHHLTTPYLTFLRVMQYSEGWKPFALLNTFHHVLMYAFFGGVTSLRPVLPWTGYFQLFVGIAVEVWLVRKYLLSNERDLLPHIVAACLLTAYLVLFIRDLAMRSREIGAKSKTA